MIRNLVKRIVKPNTYCSNAYVDFLRRKGAKIGEEVNFYVPEMSTVDYNNAEFIEIGDFVQITKGVMILAHDYSFSVLANVYHSLPRKQKKTVIGDNVFIGVNSVILMGSNIGDNVIIGAGSVVTGRVESNSVYVGNPAVKVCSLEDLYHKNINRFIESAKCYAKRFQKKHGRLPEINEMKAYCALFVDSKGLSDYANNENFLCISKEAKDNMKMPEFENKFKNVQELLDY